MIVWHTVHPGLGILGVSLGMNCDDSLWKVTTYHMKTDLCYSFEYRDHYYYTHYHTI